MPSLLDYYRPQPRPDPFGSFNSRVTYYAPGPGDRMEGGFETSRPNPQTGKRVPSTLDDVRLGTSPFVTLAGDPSRYGQTVKMGPLTYTSPIDRKSYTIPDVTGYVHDTGSAFKGRPDKLDVAAGDYRGWSPQAASAAVTADAGRRTVTPLEGDEADRAMRPIGLPEPWRATGEGYDQTAVAQGPPPPQQGRKMPNSLMDMFQPQDAAGQPTDLGGALTGRSNSLIGLGLGLLSPSNPLRGQSGWGQALEGYMGGAGLDARQATSKAAIAHQKAQEAFQRSQATQAQSNFERTFARNDPANAPTEFTRAARDLGLTPGTPEHAQFAKQFYSTKSEGNLAAQAEQRQTIAKNLGMDPADPKTRNWIAGGGALNEEGKPLPAETSARVAMAGKFLDEAPIIRSQIASGMATDSITGKVKTYLNMGDEGALAAKVKSGAEALLRALTGAGMSIPEAQKYVARYEIQPTDSSTRMLQKFDQLHDELKRSEEEAFRGRGGIPRDITERRRAAHEAAGKPPTATATDTAPSGTPTAGRGGSAPQRPANVPQGSYYSPSRNQWKLPDGTIVDAAGRPI